MNREDIIKMAEEAGWDMPSTFDESDGFCKRIEKFANLVAAHEREACARFLETGVNLSGLAGDPSMQMFCATLCKGFADAIRARGEQ